MFPAAAAQRWDVIPVSFGFLLGGVVFAYTTFAGLHLVGEVTPSLAWLAPASVLAFPALVAFLVTLDDELRPKQRVLQILAAFAYVSPLAAYALYERL